jgi:hypothetical protein
LKLPKNGNTEIIGHLCIPRAQRVSSSEFEIESDVHGKLELHSRISGLANPHLNFVIASHGQMALFPAGTMAFFLVIESTPGSFVQEIPRSLHDAADQQHAPSLPFRYSVVRYNSDW